MVRGERGAKGEKAKRQKVEAAMKQERKVEAGIIDAKEQGASRTLHRPQLPSLLYTHTYKHAYITHIFISCESPHPLIHSMIQKSMQCRRRRLRGRERGEGGGGQARRCVCNDIDH